jgi:hypothetical protein
VVNLCTCALASKQVVKSLRHISNSFWQCSACMSPTEKTYVTAQTSNSKPHVLMIAIVYVHSWPESRKESEAQEQLVHTSVLPRAPAPWSTAIFPLRSSSICHCKCITIHEADRNTHKNLLSYNSCLHVCFSREVFCSSVYRYLICAAFMALCLPDFEDLSSLATRFLALLLHKTLDTCKTDMPLLLNFFNQFWPSLKSASRNYGTC